MYRSRLKPPSSSGWVAFHGVGRGNERRDVGAVRLVRLGESARDIGALALHGGRVDEDEEGDYDQQQRPVGGNCEPGRDQEAPEVERVSGVGVGTGRRQSLVFRDVARSPAANDHPDQCDSPTHREGERGRSRKNQIGDPEDEAEWESETLWRSRSRSIAPAPSVGVAR